LRSPFRKGRTRHGSLCLVTRTNISTPTRNFSVGSRRKKARTFVLCPRVAGSQPVCSQQSLACSCGQLHVLACRQVAHACCLTIRSSGWLRRVAVLSCDGQQRPLNSNVRPRWENREAGESGNLLYAAYGNSPNFQAVGNMLQRRRVVERKHNAVGWRDQKILVAVAGCA